MGTIKTFSDGSSLKYDRGAFDDWCVYLTKPDGTSRPPKDMDYFSQLQDLAARYGTDKIYKDFVAVYDITGKEVEESALAAITRRSKSYGSDANTVDVILSILYMAMIAEERKAYSRLGKRIKRLGIYKLLYEHKSVYEAANFMRGMGWRDISAMCIERGF